MDSLTRSSATVLKLAFSCSVLVVYLLTGFEWLFHVTKISFLNGVGLAKLLLPITVPVFFLVPILVLQICLFLVAKLFRHEHFSFFVPGVLVACLAVLLFDNFTYTVVGFGVANMPAWLNVPYVAGFVAVIYMAFTQCMRLLALDHRQVNWIFACSLGLFVLSLSVTSVIVLTDYTPPQREKGAHPGAGTKRLPNILLVTVDGVESSILDFRERKYLQSSTNGIGSEFPILDRIVSQSLKAENFYTTAGFSTPAILSLLSGRSPFTFKVYYAPFKLQGLDSYQHLPNILRALGYKSAQLGSLKFVSAEVQGMKDGFDEVNLRRVSQGILGLPDVISRTLWLESNFITTITERVRERLWDIFGVEAMPDAMADVENRVAMASITDAQRISEVIRFMDEHAGAPTFVHLHMMETHPPHKDLVEYREKVTKALAKLETGLFAVLKDKKMIEEMLIVISSDHTRDWKTLERLPLYIKFPRGWGKKIVKRNADLSDVAPTILDYLDVRVPEWMSGVSLISDDVVQAKADKTILAVADVNTEIGVVEGLFEAKEDILDVVSFIRCKQAVLYDLRDGSSERRRLLDNSSECDDSLEESEMILKLKTELRRYGMLIKHY